MGSLPSEHRVFGGRRPVGDFALVDGPFARERRQLGTGRGGPSLPLCNRATLQPPNPGSGREKEGPYRAVWGRQIQQTTGRFLHFTLRARRREVSALSWVLMCIVRLDCGELAGVSQSFESLLRLEINEFLHLAAFEL
jgi:hypothetical protein